MALPCLHGQLAAMASKAEQAYEIYKKHEGLEEGLGAWHQVDQNQINLFAEATLDRQFIHIDPEQAAKLSPYKVTIAHGFLTLSLATFLTESVPPVNPAVLDGLVMAINYGLDRVRFMAPVKVDSRIRVRSKLVSAELKDDKTVQLKRELTFEIDGEKKPACIAETLGRFIYG